MRLSLDTMTTRTVGSASVHVASAGGRAAFSWAFRDGTGSAFEVNATIPHGEQGAVELLKSGAGDACHEVLRAGVSIWSSAADAQLSADDL